VLLLDVGIAAQEGQGGSLVQDEEGEVGLAEIGDHGPVGTRHRSASGTSGSSTRFEPQAQGPAGHDRVAEPFGDRQELGGGVEPFRHVPGVTDGGVAGQQDMSQRGGIIDGSGDVQRLSARATRRVGSGCQVSSRARVARRRARNAWSSPPAAAMADSSTAIRSVSTENVVHR
jgi:hypothetical protein